jgi:hypothetical protein
MFASAGHHRHVGVLRFHASLRQQAMDLSSMMGLVVDEVRHEPPNRPTDIARGALREIGQLPGQPVGAEAFGPAHDLRIEVDPLTLEPIPIGIQRRGELSDDQRPEPDQPLHLFR